MAFDRGYLSHHMVTDIETMQVVLDEPFILMTDLKLQTQEEVAAIRAVVGGQPPPAADHRRGGGACLRGERCSAAREQGGPPVAAIHPPEYGHWRKSMLEDHRHRHRRPSDRARSRRTDRPGDAARSRHARGRCSITANQTIISAGGGDPARSPHAGQQVARQLDLAPPNIERDKLAERLARLAGGSAMILAGGATPVEQKRRAQLIEDAVNAARAAAEEGVVPGGGTALLQVLVRRWRASDGLSDSARRGRACCRPHWRSRCRRSP